MIRNSLAPRLLILSLLLLPIVPTDGGAEPAASQTEAATARSIIEANQLGQLLPSAKALFPEIDLEGAYRIQRQLVASKFGGRTPSGYKVGFTTRASWEALELDGPVAAVLPPEGRLEGSPELKLRDFRLLWIETEVAFEIGRYVEAPLENIEAAKQTIYHVRPAIELPDVTLASLEPLIAEDLVAANLLSRAYLVGPPVDSSFDLETLRISMSRDGEPFHTFDGRGTDELWAGVQWAINHVFEQGYPIEPGMIFLGGALGPPRPAPPGNYQADYGELGELSFSIR